VNHSVWRLYRPTVESDSARFRSLIYVNRKLSTSSYRQVLCNHPDLTAVKIWTGDTQILILSVYIPPVPMHTPEEASAATEHLSYPLWRFQPPPPSVGWQPHSASIRRGRRRANRLLLYKRPSKLSSAGHCDFLVAEPPGKKLHYRPDRDRQTRLTR
jgi:hypothetical protein